MIGTPSPLRRQGLAMMMVNNGNDDDTSRDGHETSPVLRMAGTGVEQWRDPEVRTMSDVKEGPLPDDIGQGLTELTRQKPDQDQADAIDDGSKVNESSPELVRAMEDLCSGLTQCQLEDYDG